MPHADTARSPALKLLLAGALTLAMAVPLFFIFLLLMDRTERRDEAAAEIAQAFGGAQRIAGPFLIVPMTVLERREEDGRTVTTPVRRDAVFLPRTLQIDGAAATELRRRGLFDVTVYTAALSVSGAFGPADIAATGLSPETVHWEQARIALAVSDVRSFAENVTLAFGPAAAVPFKPGLPGALGGGAGISAPVAFDPAAAETPFRLALSLRGSGELSFAPAGETTEVTLRSPWAHPSFAGAFLPEERSVGAEGFAATWRVPFLARAFPQAYPAGAYGLEALDVSAFGVRFFVPIDIYELVARALKYAILFVGLAFLTVFLIELASGARVHAVQYLLIGAAQVVFYLLLLALSEHAGFALAYAAAAGATVLLTTLYAWPALGGVLRALGVCAALSALYALLYVVLNEEDFALVIGAGAVFLALALTMFVTRRIDWH